MTSSSLEQRRLPCAAHSVAASVNVAADASAMPVRMLLLLLHTDVPQPLPSLLQQRTAAPVASFS